LKHDRGKVRTTNTGYWIPRSTDGLGAGPLKTNYTGTEKLRWQEKGLHWGRMPTVTNNRWIWAKNIVKRTGPREITKILARLEFSKR